MDKSHFQPLTKVSQRATADLIIYSDLKSCVPWPRRRYELCLVLRLRPNGWLSIPI